MPLSEHEQKLLEQLERQLHEDDPKFASSMGSDPGRTWSTRHIVIGVLATLAGVLLLLVGWMISIAGAFVRFHGFTLSVDGGEMRKRYGLLTVHEASVPLQRVQAIRVEETFLRRWLGLASLMIETAGGSPGRSRRSARPPTRGCRSSSWPAWGT